MKAEIAQLRRVLATAIIWIAQSANSPLNLENAQELLKMLEVFKDGRQTMTGDPSRCAEPLTTKPLDVPCPKCGVCPGETCRIPQPFEMTPRQWEREIDGQWHRARIRIAARDNRRAQREQTRTSR